ncbi:septum formation initiator family protein [uncultured Faecalibaculum sp.]|uniref:FtsB family cell division protein n=1 Tax=uncultured Faecalibaculum sp. TaxID=1729681 RepID=UPI0025D63882|nr:septum formation initiator family protein [uncultured Faecalibaculum sp.]
MKGRRKRRRGSNDLLICIGCVAGSAFLFWAGWQDVRNLLEIRESIAANEEKSAQLDQRQSNLETARENLDNPDYVEYIARGRYLVTKEGEQVFKFPSLQEDGE